MDINYIYIYMCVYVYVRIIKQEHYGPVGLLFFNMCYCISSGEYTNISVDLEHR